MNQTANQEVTVTAMTPKVNREHKDTLFRMIFSDKEKLLNLFNALNGTHYTDADELEFRTLENAIYMAKKNDISFLIACELHFYEHQSTKNPNVPLRDLHYFSQTILRDMHGRSLYSTALQKIPTPRFFLFYNGQEDQLEQQELRLSDAFQHPVEHPDLELKVTMFNINHGKNQELMEQCKDLKDYAVYIAAIRDYATMHDIQTAVELAIEECIKKGILAEFLSKHRSEAIATSIFEYEEEKEMELIREDERRVGFTEGEMSGFTKGEASGFTKGEASGFTKGEALNCIKVIKKMYSRSTPCDLAELLELSEEVVLEVIAALEADPHQDVQELVKIILV